MSTSKRIISLLISVILLISSLEFTLTASAATTNSGGTIKISGACAYDEAFEVFNKVNALRKSKGLSALKMNPQMLQDAMQRAAEIAVNYSHQRPDNSDGLSINKEVYGENIAIVFTDVDSVMEGWTNSSYHYANMVSKTYNSMGVGVFTHNSTRYWVQLFGISSAAGTTQVPANADKDFNIYLGSKTYNLSLVTPDKFFVTDKDAIQVTGKNAAYDRYFIVKPSSLTWSSNNTKVLSMSSNNSTALAEGSATITAKNSAATVTKKVTVNTFGKGKSNKCGDNITWSYNNKTLTFSGSGEMYNYTTNYDSSGMTSTNLPWADGMDKVTSVTISEGITAVGNSAFACFSKLSSVKLPSTLTKIGEKAFACCTNIKSISIPQKVSSLGASAFHKCSSLTSVDLPDKITQIPDNLFYSCGNLKTVSIPNTVEKIGTSAFAYCYKLTNLTLPSKLKSIGALAFISCEALKEITIPYTVDSIEKKAFSGCKALAKVTFLNPSTIISTEDTFKGTSSSLKIYGYNKSSAQKYCSDKGITFSKLSGKTIQAQASGYSIVYTSNPVTTDITVKPTNITGEYNIKFSKGNSFDYTACFDSIKKLGEYWRDGAPYSNRISNYLVDCATYPISYCIYASGCEPAFGTVNITVNKASPNFSFKNQSMSIPWYSKGDNTGGFFTDIQNLGDLKVTDITFTTDKSSTLITDCYGKIYPKRYGECTVTATYNGDKNHNSRTATMKVTIYPVGELTAENFNCIFSENGTVAIKRNFHNTQSITVPSKILNADVTTIQSKAFFSSGVETLTISNGITTIEDSAFSACYAMTTLNLPESLTYIGAHAFSGCKKLTSVTIPASVTTIGKEAFGYTSPDISPDTTKIEGFVIYGYKNSAAEKYAIDNGFEFVQIGIAQPGDKIGDVDGDGDVSIMDATAIQMYIALLIEFDDNQIRLADFTQDGVADILDATGIQLMLVGLA